MVRFLVCLAMAAARLGELAYSKRNIEEGADGREGAWSQRTYPLMVALHTATIAGTLFAGGKTRWRWLLLLLAAQPLRFWVLSTLQRNWNTRGSVAADTEVQTGGPYAHIRHPNYVVVAIELATLPLAFGLRGLALFATFANAMLLTFRIREEEALLEQLPGYREHFEHKARFVPGIV